MNRLSEIQNIIDNILSEQPNKQERHNIYVHLYAVSSFCSLLAHKRGLNVELCAISGMLHDISSYKNGYSVEHAKLGSIEARKILSEANCFDNSEIDIICHSILNHSNKLNADNDYDEILKDADVLHHYLFNTNLPVEEKEKKRLKNLFSELELR